LVDELILTGKNAYVNSIKNLWDFGYMRNFSKVGYPPVDNRSKVKAVLAYEV
jgi:hypothetical protein